MSMQTKISAKGQVVLPQAIRRQFDWQTGKTLEVISLADGIVLRAIRTRPHRPPEEVFAELGSIRPNIGPPVTDDEMHEIVVAEATKRYDFWR